MSDPRRSPTRPTNASDFWPTRRSKQETSQMSIISNTLDADKAPLLTVTTQSLRIAIGEDASARS